MEVTVPKTAIASTMCASMLWLRLDSTGSTQTEYRNGCSIMNLTPILQRGIPSFHVGTWLSLVEHSLGVRGVGSSNLPVPTILKISGFRGFAFQPRILRRVTNHPAWPPWRVVTSGVMWGRHRTCEKSFPFRETNRNRPFRMKASARKTACFSSKNQSRCGKRSRP